MHHDGLRFRNCSKVRFRNKTFVRFCRIISYTLECEKNVRLAARRILFVHNICCGRGKVRLLCSIFVTVYVVNVYRAVVRHPQLRHPGNYFIVSLACSDLVLSLIYPLYNIAHLELQQIQDVLGNVSTDDDFADHNLHTA